MPVPRLFSEELIGPRDVVPSRDDFEVVGVFNPGVATIGDEIVLLIRVAERLNETRFAYTSLPRWEGGQLFVEWIANDDLEPLDPRLVRVRQSGLVRLTFTSHLRLTRLSSDGRSVREMTNIALCPQQQIEEYGIEDPRITLLDGRYYVTYVAVSRHGPATALVSTTDFRTFESHGTIFCAENKDVVIFPEKINGLYAALHRPVCGTPFTRPEMWLAWSPDLVHWGQHEPLHIEGTEWQSGRLGAGCPPLRTDEGWLVVYHGNRRPTAVTDVGAYTAGMLLLDFTNPARIIKQTAEPFMVPDLGFEKLGFIPNVVFPTGLIEQDDRLLVYYGAADTSVGVVAFDRRELLAALV